MDCPRCGAPLSARDVECRFCGRGRDVVPPIGHARPTAARARDPESGTCVEILAVGSNKISVIKVLRESLNIGLREAKDLSESPTPIRVSVDVSRLGKVLADLREAGANARLF